MFGIIVPTGDNYSDIWTSLKFFFGTYTPAGTHFYGNWIENRNGYNVYEYLQITAQPQTMYGLMTLLPPLISFIMTSIHWYQTEEKSQRLRTLPLLLLQIWPQYRTGRILWLYMKNDKKWIQEKKHVEMQLSSIGEFIQTFHYF